MDRAPPRYIAEIRQLVLLIRRATYRPSPWSASDPLVPRHVEDEHGRATEGDLDLVGHVELAWLHDRAFDRAQRRAVKRTSPPSRMHRNHPGRRSELTSGRSGEQGRGIAAC